MPQQINKKIFFYFFLFIFLGTFNNKNFNNFKLPKIDSIEIYGLKTIDDDFIRSLEFFKLSNIFYINQSKIKKILKIMI